MKLHRHLAPVLLLPLVACEPKEKVVIQTVEVPVEKIVEVYKDPTTGEVIATPAGEGEGDGSSGDPSMNVSMIGTLALSTGEGEGTGLGLRGFGLVADTETDYSLNCMTFETPARSFSLPVMQDAGGGYYFDGKLDNAAGVSLGCFLLYKGTPQTPILFGAESSLVPGSGTIKSKITFNPDTKNASGEIDASSSDALDSSSIESAMRQRGSLPTNLKRLSGTYAVTCDSSQAGFNCDDGTTVPSKLYLSRFTVGDESKVAIWKDAASRNRCVPADVPDATDASPGFGLRIGSTLLGMDFASQDTLNASLDTGYATLKGASTAHFRKLADVIEAQAIMREGWKVQYCDQNPFDDSNNCKLMLAETESYTYTDYMSGKEVTYSYTKWIDDTAFNSAVDYAGSVTSKSIPCASYWTPELDICPLGTITDENDKGSYTVYFGINSNNAEARLRLVCKDPAGGWIRYQENAMVGTKSGAMAAAKTANGCDVIADAGPYNNKYSAIRDGVRSAFSEITATAVNYGANLCRHYSVPLTFNLATCNSASMPAKKEQLNYTYREATKPAWITWEPPTGYTWQAYDATDRSQEELCRWIGWNSDYWGFVIDGGGHLTWNGTTKTMSPWNGQDLCPTAHAAYQTDSDYTAFQDACPAELNAMVGTAQVETLLRARTGSWDPLRYAACTAMDEEVRSDFRASVEQTCLPQAGIAYMCGSNGCVSRLRCYGTPRGACVDEQGTFIGRIANRIGVMSLTPKTDGAFEATSVMADKWMAWNFTDNKMRSCNLTNDTVMSGQLDADGTGFSSYYKERVKQVCEDVSAEDMYKGFNATGAGGANGGGGGGENSQESDSMPEKDILKLLKFTRCDNDACI